MNVSGSVAGNVARVRKRIAGAGGDPAAVRVVAVTKGFGPDAVEAAMAAGVTDVGESYAQELTAKAAVPALATARWHFVGRLQSNKVKGLAPVVHLWQSVDRASLVGRLGEHAPGAAILVQVNVAADPRQGGCPPSSVADLVRRARQAGLEVRGLMAIGAPGPERARSGFRRLRELADEHGLMERSMGMSTDLEVAVQEGSTMVRVGRALFGPRPPRGDVTDPAARSFQH